MTASSSEYLRRKMDAATKVVAPRPIGDASVLTQIRRYRASKPVAPKEPVTDCCRVYPGRIGDGQQQIWSSEGVLAAVAGCAVCSDPPQIIRDIDCCPYTEPTTKPLALQGSQSGCCPFNGGLPPTTPECCCAGKTNTWWANCITPGTIVPVPGCTTCPPPIPTCQPCCL